MVEAVVTEGLPEIAADWGLPRKIDLDTDPANLSNLPGQQRSKSEPTSGGFGAIIALLRKSHWLREDYSGHIDEDGNFTRWHNYDGTPNAFSLLAAINYVCYTTNSGDRAIHAVAETIRLR